VLFNKPFNTQLHVARLSFLFA